ncbi:MAG: hypothetical protein ACRERE_09240, partial [Candidatus Entotheonellia bacterium]
MRQRCATATDWIGCDPFQLIRKRRQGWSGGGREGPVGILRGAGGDDGGCGWGSAASWAGGVLRVTGGGVSRVGQATGPFTCRVDRWRRLRPGSAGCRTCRAICGQASSHRSLQGIAPGLGPQVLPLLHGAQVGRDRRHCGEGLAPPRRPHQLPQGLEHRLGGAMAQGMALGGAPPHAGRRALPIPGVPGSRHRPGGVGNISQAPGLRPVEIDT